MKTFNIPTIPGEFQWQVPPVEWSYTPGKELSILAGPLTDCFNDPAGTISKDNAPCALVTFPPGEAFLLSAKVSVEFASAYDAGVLQVRGADGHWAKLCFEYSPQGQPMIVSVVNHGVSDDCNSVEVAGTVAYLRMAWAPPTVAFHYSRDGRVWHFVRYFSLGASNALRAGFSAQSPTGEKCRAVFTEISYRQGRLQDNRNGE